MLYIDATSSLGKPMRDRSARRIRASASHPVRPGRLHPLLCVILLAGLIVAGLAMAPSAAQANPRYAGLVIDAVSGEVFYQENANRRLYPASLTKMMTLYMTFQALEDGRLSLHQRLTVSHRAASQPPSHLGLPPGSTITVEQAIYALVTKSANDIATVLAEAIGDSEARFARLMTEEARRLGMTRTTFRNASGLPNGEQRTTAWDISRLARALRRDFPQYYHYFATERWRFRGQTYRNHNRLLGSYDGVDGLKTGYIRASGFNLAVSATRGRLSVIAIVFGGRTSQSRNAHMVDLLDRAFDSDRGEYLIAHGSMPFDPPAPPALPDRRIIQLIAGGETIDLVPPETPEPRADAGPQLIVAVPRDEPAEPPLAAPVPARRPGEPIVLAAAPRGEPVPEALADLPLPPTPPMDMRPDLGQMAARLENTAPTGEPGGDWAAGLAPPIAGWGIQVGAFSDVATSRAAMDRATARLPGMLGDAVPQIAVLDEEGGRLFRARLVGLSEDTAAQACARLDSAGQPCMTVAPGE
jgi:D-alanyl-D-alanine carboxypeptidase